MKTALLAAVLLFPSLACAQGTTIFVGPRGTTVIQPTVYGGWYTSPRGFGTWFSDPYPYYPTYYQPVFVQQYQPYFYQPAYQPVYQRWGF